MNQSGLYAIVDVTFLEARRLPVVEVAQAIVAARPVALQLRAKGVSPRETLALLKAILPACKQAGVPLFANDRPDLAVLADCDGVHLGQDDLPISAVRKVAPHLRVGISTHDPDQLDAALASQPDYVAFGPIFATHSKANPDAVVGVPALERACKKSTVPVVAIGGIDLERAATVARAGALGAVISALIPDDITENGLSPITARARALERALAARA